MPNAVGGEVHGRDPRGRDGVVAGIARLDDRRQVEARVEALPAPIDAQVTPAIDGARHSSRGAVEDGAARTTHALTDLDDLAAGHEDLTRAQHGAVPEVELLDLDHAGSALAALPAELALDPRGVDAHARLGGRAVQHDEVRVLAGGEAADAIGNAQQLGGGQGDGAERIRGGEAAPARHGGGLEQAAHVHGIRRRDGDLHAGLDQPRGGRLVLGVPKRAAIPGRAGRRRRRREAPATEAAEVEALRLLGLLPARLVDHGDAGRRELGGQLDHAGARLEDERLPRLDEEIVQGLRLARVVDAHAPGAAGLHQLGERRAGQAAPLAGLLLIATRERHELAEADHRTHGGARQLGLLDPEANVHGGGQRGLPEAGRAARGGRDAAVDGGAVAQEAAHVRLARQLGDPALTGDQAVVRRSQVGRGHAAREGAAVAREDVEVVGGAQHRRRGACSRRALSVAAVGRDEARDDGGVGAVVDLAHARRRLEVTDLDDLAVLDQEGAVLQDGAVPHEVDGPCAHEHGVPDGGRGEQEGEDGQHACSWVAVPRVTPRRPCALPRGCP